MAAKPNFTKVRLAGGKVTVQGESNSQDLDDIVGIHVLVRQEAKAGEDQATLAAGSVAQAGSTWEAELDDKGFAAGPAMALGVETHSDPLTAISWAESVEIEE
jgi:hypothetical protein